MWKGSRQFPNGIAQAAEIQRTSRRPAEDRDGWQGTPARLDIESGAPELPASSCPHVECPREFGNRVQNTAGAANPRACRLRGSHQDELLIARLGPSSHRVGADLS